MNHGGPLDGWRQRFIQALSLFLIVSILARWIFDLLAPMLPVLIPIAIGLGIWQLVQRRRQW